MSWFSELWTRGVKCHDHHGALVSRTKWEFFPFFKIMFINGIGFLECPASSFETHSLATRLPCHPGYGICLIQGEAPDPPLANQSPYTAYLDLGLGELSVSLQLVCSERP